MNRLNGWQDPPPLRAFLHQLVPIALASAYLVGLVVFIIQRASE